MLTLNPRKRAKDLVILMVVLFAAILSPVAYFSNQAQQDISEQFISSAAALAVSEFHAMAESITATLGLVRDWGDTEFFSAVNDERLNQLLFPIFEREKLLYGISVADTLGNSYYVRKSADALRTSRIDAAVQPRQSVDSVWRAGDAPVSVETTASEYDPRLRPWFAPALSAEADVWTDPYQFYSSKNVGITVSTSYLRKKDQQPVVVAFDILLDELFLKIHALTPSENGRVFVFRRDAKLYIPQTEQSASDFLAMGAVKDPLVRKIYSNWAGGTAAESEVVSILHEGSTWWAGFLPLDKDHRTTWICVMVPEQDIAGPAGDRSKTLWLAGLCAALLAVILAYWIFRSYGRKLADGAPEFAIVDADLVQRLVAGGETDEVEFKATMRMNLHAKRPGKEIELAWLKGVAAFLNTDGGTLLLGVTDDGEITGLEQDVFENEDKCKLHFKNLIAQHLGVEVSEYIRFQIVSVADKTVGVVSCRRSADPVFLLSNKSEAFYIRNGPSSDELPVSKALGYIAKRQE